MCIHSKVCTACAVRRLLRMMSTHMFANLIMKYHRQEQTKGKINYVIVHLANSALCMDICVFLCVFLSHS